MRSQEDDPSRATLCDMKWLGVPASAAVGITVLGVAVLAPSSSGARAGQVSECVSARVHYEPGPRRDLRALPWVSAGRREREIVGYLFYYSSSRDDPRVSENPGLVIYAGGLLPGGNAATKILWVPRVAQRSWLTISGRRLDGPGAFSHRERVASGAVFPSIPEIPEPGCWRLTLRNGRQVVRLAVLAI